MNPGSVLPLLGFAAFTTAIVIAAVTLGLRQQRKARELLAALATRLGLELRRQPAKLGFEPTPTVDGPYRGRQVRFYSYTTGSGKHRSTWCAVAAAVKNPSGFTLELCPENFLFRIATGLGMQDIKLNDPAFDPAFIVKSNDPAYAIAALLPEIRTQLLEERKRRAYGSLVIKDGEVRYSEMGSFGQADQVDRFARMLEPVCDLAEVADVYQQTP